MGKYVTMQDIAKRLNVSNSAVSFALNDRYDCTRISDAIRKKIKQTAKEMGYCRNAVVQSLVTGRTRQIAIVTFSGSSYEYISRNINGFVEALTKKKYSCQFFYADNQDLDQLYQQIIEMRIEGIVTHGDMEVAEYLIKRSRERKIPVVVLDKPAIFDAGIFVKSDDVQGTRDSVEYLYKSGHRHIGYFGLLGTCDMRKGAFFDTIRELGIENHEEDNWFTSDHLEQHQMIEKLLSRPTSERPSAYCCASDYIAATMEFIAIKLGIKIPEELSIIGFGNLRDVALIHSGLTTVEQKFEQEGAVAAELLVEDIESKKYTSLKKSIQKDIPTKLIIRETTKAKK